MFAASREHLSFPHTQYDSRLALCQGKTSTTVPLWKYGTVRLPNCGSDSLWECRTATMSYCETGTLRLRDCRTSTLPHCETAIPSHCDTTALTMECSRSADWFAVGLSGVCGEFANAVIRCHIVTLALASAQTRVWDPFAARVFVPTTARARRYDANLTLSPQTAHFEDVERRNLQTQRVLR